MRTTDQRRQHILDTTYRGTGVRPPRPGMAETVQGGKAAGLTLSLAC